MIQKFATVPVCRIVLTLTVITILAGATTLHAQQTPAAQQPAQQQPAQQAQPENQPPDAQQPDAQQPSTQQPSAQPSGPQETAPEIGLGRKPKVKDWKNWSFNAGGGASTVSGTTGKYVRGGGLIAGAGVARNYGKYFGFRLDFQYDNLPLRSTALQQAQAPGATSHVYTFMLDPIVNFSVTKTWGGYILGGATYFHRTGKLDSSTAINGAGCNGFWLWWGSCFAGSLPVYGSFLKTSENQIGEDFGGGVTYKITPKFEIYGEYRLLHAKHDTTSTDLHPITLGLRW